MVRDATHVAPNKKAERVWCLVQEEICRGLQSEVGSGTMGGAAYAQACDAGCGRCGGGLPRGAAPGGLRGSTRSRSGQFVGWEGAWGDSVQRCLIKGCPARAHLVRYEP